jgi:hypothetical protein
MASRGAGGSESPDRTRSSASPENSSPWWKPDGAVMTPPRRGERAGESERPPAAELAARLQGILAAGERLIARVSGPHADDVSRARARMAREAAYQMFRDGLAFADAMDRGQLPPDWLQAGPPPALRDGADVARYGALVRARLSGWFEGVAPSEYARTIDTERGPERADALLEITVREAAHRLARLGALLRDLGLPSDDKP